MPITAVNNTSNSAVSHTSTQGPTPTDISRAINLTKLAQNGTPEQIGSALQGKDASIGKLSNTEKSGLVSKSLETWDSQMTGWNYGKGVSDNLKKSETLLNSVKGDAQLTDIVKGEMARKPLNVVLFYNNDKSSPDGSFDRAAYTYGREHNANVYIPFLTADEFKNSWNQLASSGRVVSNVGYVGHSGPGTLYMSNSELNNSDIAKLQKLNYAPGAKMDMFSCQSADGDPNDSTVIPVAKEFANTQGIPTTGQNGRSVFSTDKDSFNATNAFIQDIFRTESKNISADWNGKLYLSPYFRKENKTDPEVRSAMNLPPEQQILFTWVNTINMEGDLNNVRVPSTTFSPLPPSRQTKLYGPN